MLIEKGKKNKKKTRGKDFQRATNEQISTVKTTWVSAHASPSNGGRKKRKMSKGRRGDMIVF